MVKAAFSFRLFLSRLRPPEMLSTQSYGNADQQKNGCVCCAPLASRRLGSVGPVIRHGDSCSAFTQSFSLRTRPAPACRTGPLCAAAAGPWAAQITPPIVPQGPEAAGQTALPTGRPAWWPRALWRQRGNTASVPMREKEQVAEGAVSRCRWEEGQGVGGAMGAWWQRPGGGAGDWGQSAEKGCRAQRCSGPCAQGARSLAAQPGRMRNRLAGFRADAASSRTRPGLRFVFSPESACSTY